MSSGGGGGRRGGGGRGGHGREMPRDQQVSRKVSWLLRHGADKEGLVLGKGGYVNVRDAVSSFPFFVVFIGSRG
jgi:2'-phosphotransferase